MVSFLILKRLMIESDIFVIANFAKEFLKILLKNFRISVQKRLNEIDFFFFLKCLVPSTIIAQKFMIYETFAEYTHRERKQLSWQSLIIATWKTFPHFGSKRSIAEGALSTFPLCDRSSLCIDPESIDYSQKTINFF